jgi:hypothetical protein
MTKEETQLKLELSRLSPVNLGKVALYFYGKNELIKGMIRDLKQQGDLTQTVLAISYIKNLTNTPHER